MQVWPEAVAGAVVEVVGRPGVRTPLTGLSGSAVERVDGPHGSVVVKRASVREVGFYASLAPLLPPGVRVPHAFWAADGWLVLEHVPSALPRERWLADPHVMRFLVALHGAGVPTPSGPFVPEWSDDLTGRALERLTTSAEPALDRARTVALAAWAGDGLVSGDTNPRNWGLAADGAVVLMDWERVGLAAPVLDVAVTVPGLGSTADVAAVVTAYERAGGDVVPVEAVAAVKAWTAVELLAQPRTDSLGPVHDHLRDALPGWLATWW